MADEWWDVNGKFKPSICLIQLGEYITENIKSYYKIKKAKISFLEGLTILDIGRGRSLSERIARLGAKVTGIDASEKNIIAKLHSEKVGLK